MATLRGQVPNLLVGLLLAAVLVATSAAAYAYDYDGGTRSWIGERVAAAAPVGEQPVGGVRAGRPPGGHRYDDFANLARGSARLGEYRLAPQASIRITDDGLRHAAEQPLKRAAGSDGPGRTRTFGPPFLPISLPRCPISVSEKASL